MPKYTVFLLLCIAFAGSVCGQISTRIILIAIEDAYICSDDWADRNFGTADFSPRAVGQQNDYDGNQIGRMLYKFELPDDILSIHGAFLQLKVWDNGAGNPVATGIYGVEGQWAETEVTWNNQPVHNESVLDSVIVQCCYNTYNYDVTAYVESRYLSDPPTLSFMQKTVDETKIGGMRWFTRESLGNTYSGSFLWEGIPPKLILDAVIPESAIQGHTIRSDFSFDSEGWKVVDLASVVGNPPIEELTRNPIWHAAGGRPEGYISQEDIRTGWLTFAAPDLFLGDKSWAYGGHLTCQLRDNLSDGINYWGVCLVGSEHSLYWLLTPPVPNWTSVFVPLCERGWRMDSPDGPTPSQEQFRLVLSDLKRLYINGEWHTGDDVAWLDSVVLVPDCPADINGDNRVDPIDLVFLAEQWLGEGSIPSADITPGLCGEGTIDILDFAFLASYWEQSCYTTILSPVNEN